MRRRVAGAVAAAIMLWSTQDAIIWRIWFDGRPWSPAADLYQFWHQAFLVALIVLGVVWLRGAWGVGFALATWTLANGGLPDALYYWIALKPIPALLPWLDQTHPLIITHPATSGSILVSSMAWIVLWMVVLLWTSASEQKDLMKELIHRKRRHVAVRGSL